jgi:hypothetical protein
MRIYVILLSFFMASSGFSQDKYPNITLNQLMPLTTQGKIGIQKLNQEEKEALRLYLIELYLEAFNKGKSTNKTTTSAPTNTVSCQDCSGKGKKNCTYCFGKDLTKQICNYCNGRDLTKQICNYCNGKDLTKQLCQYCNGAGQKDGKRCVMCSASGKKKPCIMCGASGFKKPCVMCGASGKKKPCVMCKTTGILICGTCSGTGKYTEGGKEKESSSSSGIYAGVGSGHWIQKNIDSGSYIKLEDGSLWEIDALEKIDAMLWLAISNITVVESNNGSPGYDYLLINTDDGEKAHAKYISQ